MMSPHHKQEQLLPVFDAAAVLMAAQSETSTPAEIWPTSALIQVLQNVARSWAVIPGDDSPHLRRLIDGTNALAYLMQRGLDGQALLTHGVGQAIATAIDACLAFIEVDGDTSWQDWSHLEPWRKLRSHFADDQATGPELRLNDLFRSSVMGWISTSDACDVLSWVPPEDFLPRPADLDTAKAEEYSWFVTRMTRTYLSDWPAEDLQLEYRMLKGDWKPEHVPLALVAERTESRAAVTEAIAAKQLSGVSPDTETLAVLTHQAVDFINQGERERAATVFSAARAVEPRNPHFANNYAFCILPENPRAALEAFNEARQLGRDDVVVRSNLALAYSLIGQKQSALDVLEEFYQPPLEALSAFLWVVNDIGEFEMHTLNAWAYFCDLAIQLARELDDPSLAVWRSRRETVPEGGL
jgi:hypothetical protein